MGEYLGRISLVDSYPIIPVTVRTRPHKRQEERLLDHLLMVLEQLL